MYLVLFYIFGFLSAVFLESLYDLPQFSWLFLLGTIALFKWPRIAVFLIFVYFGFLRVQIYEEEIFKPVDLGNVYGLKGEIVEEIDRRSDHQKITVLTERGRVLAKVSAYKDLEYGDFVEISGELERPSEDIEGFNYSNYLARYRIALVMNPANVLLTSRGPPSFKKYLFSFKTAMENRLNTLFFEPEASFAAGLLLGSRKGMPDELADAFRRVGLTHIVAISGYNITLVIAAMFLLFSFIPLKMRVVVSSVAIVVFVILVGGSAAVVRAGIMGVLTLWGLFAGRKSQVFFALLWSALIMIIYNPYVLVYDVGFQLSFASTLGLLVFVPILELKVPGSGLLREALLLTLAAQIATFPFMAFHFARVSIISPVANVLAAPFLPFAMFFSALALIFGKTLAVFAWFHLWMVEQIALKLAKLPWIDVPVSLNALDFIGVSAFLILLSLWFYKSTLVRAFCRDSQEVFYKYPFLE